MFKKILSFVYVFLLLQNAVFSDEIVRLDLKKAMELAVERNFDIQGRRKDVPIASNKIKAANRLQETEIEVMILTGDTSIGNPQTIGFDQQIEILKRGPRKRHAMAEKNVVTTAVDLDIFNLKMDVREAYINLAKAKSIFSIVKKQQESLAKMLHVATRRFEVGVAPEIERLQAKIMYDQIITARNQAETLVVTSKIEFNRALNFESNEVYDINEDELPTDGKFLELSTPSPKDEPPSLEIVEKIAFENRRDIKIAYKEIDVAKKNLAVQLSKRIPDIDIEAGFMYLSDFQNNDFTVSNGGPLYGAYFGGDLNLPLFYRYGPEIKNAKIEIEKKQLNYESTKIKALYDVKKAYRNFEVARKNLNFYTDTLLDESIETVRISTRSYEVGKTPLSSLILMQQSNLAILTNYVYALSAYYIAWIDLLREMNVDDIN